MSSSRFTLATLATGLILAPVVPWLLASCADTDDTGPPFDNPPNLLDASPGPDTSTVDGGCDASDHDCVSVPISCEEADWCPVTTEVSTFYSLTSVWGSGPNDVWATGSGGTVIHWDGAAWKATVLPSKSTLPIKDTFHALWGSGPNDVWIAAATDVIFHTDGFKDGKATWVRAPNATNDSHSRATLYAAWGTGPEDLRFGGSSSSGDEGIVNQVVKAPAEGGIAWRREGSLATIHGFWGSSADDLWMVADNRPYFPQLAGMTFHGTRVDGAFVWTSVDSRTNTVLRSIWGSSANDIWAVGGNGTIRHLGSDLTEWSVVASPTQENLHGVWGSGPNDVWIVGESGTILHWDGSAWKPSLAAFPAHKLKPNLYGIWGSGPNDIWIVGDDTVLHHTGGAK